MPRGVWDMQSRATSEPSVPCDLDSGLDILGGEAVEEMGEEAGAKPDQAQRRVLDALRRHAAVLGEGGDRLRFVVEDEAEEVGIVHREVEDGAGSGDRIIEPPALEMLRQIAGVDDARRERAPDPSRLDRDRGSPGGSLNS